MSCFRLAFSLSGGHWGIKTIECMDYLCVDRAVWEVMESTAPNCPSVLICGALATNSPPEPQQTHTEAQMLHRLQHVQESTPAAVSQASGDRHICPVCLDPLGSIMEDETVTLAPCGHVLCAKCADSFPRSSACPVCRAIEKPKVQERKT